MCWDKILIEGHIVRKWMVIGLSLSLGTTIYLIFLSISSFQGYTVSSDIDDLIANWRKEPVTQALVGYECSEYLTQYKWSGVRSGCDCSGSLMLEIKTITFFQCSREQLINKCVQVDNIDEAVFNSWPTNSPNPSMFSACLIRLTGENFINSHAKQTDDCSQTSSSSATYNKQKVKCGFNQSTTTTTQQSDNSYAMCLTQCPFVNIFNEADSLLPANSNRIVGSISSTFFYSMSSEGEKDYPIVEFVSQIPTVCLSQKGRSDVTSDQNGNTQYTSTWQYTLQKEYLQDSCQGEDTRYFPIAKMSIQENLFLISSGISQINNYPGYPSTSFVTLFARRIISWKNQCREDGMLEDLVTFYDTMDYYQDLRFSSIMCETGMLIIICTLLLGTVCEMGWRVKQPYCCKYQSPSWFIRLCRKKRIDINICDYLSLYDPCYVLCAFVYVILQIGCFVISLIYSIRSSAFAIHFKSISKSACSDDLTNSILTAFSADYTDNVWAKDSILVIVYPAFFVVQAIAFILIARIVTNHRRQSFLQQMHRRSLQALTNDYPILTSEESEEENYKKQLIQSKIVEKQRQQQNQVLQADFIQRTNLINQSLSFFQTSKNNLTNSGQLYQYELSRISQIQQANSFNNNSFNNTLQYNNNKQYNTNFFNNTIQNSLNNSSIQDQNPQNIYQSNSNDSKQANPPSETKTSSLFYIQKKQFSEQTSNPLRGGSGLKDNFLSPEAL